VTFIVPSQPHSLMSQRVVSFTPRGVLFLHRNTDLQASFPYYIHARSRMCFLMSTDKANSSQMRPCKDAQLKSSSTKYKHSNKTETIYSHPLCPTHKARRCRREPRLVQYKLGPLRMPNTILPTRADLHQTLTGPNRRGILTSTF
jgi:hypothetical protein